MALSPDDLRAKFRQLPQEYAVVDVDRLRLHPANANEGDKEAIRESIEENGFFGAVYVQKRTGFIIAGNHRWREAVTLGAQEIPVIYLDVDDELALAILAVDNRSTRLGKDNEQRLAAILERLAQRPNGLAGTGYSSVDLDALKERIKAASGGGGGSSEKRDKAEGTLSQRFGVPPFTVLDARQGYWQERKNAWIALGLRSAEGRDANLCFDGTAQPKEVVRKKNEKESELNRKLSWTEFFELCPEVKPQQLTTSIFDPVLCELLVRWFCPEGGAILDPFAGGCVRGVISSRLGRKYTGVDLRPEQLDENRAQAALLCPENPPTWIEGDSREIKQLAPGEYDFVLSCPPYADLERYSDDPRDLSTMPYADFLAAYRQIIWKSLEMLKPNRFACFVVGDVRDDKGFYRNFVGDTVQAFEAGGARFYNEAILVTIVNSTALRAGKQMAATRKLAKTHQNVLVFFKGDPATIKDTYLDCGFEDLGGTLEALQAKLSGESDGE